MPVESALGQAPSLAPKVPTSTFISPLRFGRCPRFCEIHRGSNTQRCSQTQGTLFMQRKYYRWKENGEPRFSEREPDKVFSRSTRSSKVGMRGEGAMK